MAVDVEAFLVVNNIVTPVEPDAFTSFDIVGQPGAVVEIAPETSAPIPDPLTGQLLRYLDGVIVAVNIGGLSGTASAISATLPTATPQTQPGDDVEEIIYTFTQSDGSQAVVRAVLSGADKITVQEFLNGFNLDDLLVVADTLNGVPYDGGTTPPTPVDPFAGTQGDDNLIGDADAQQIDGAGGNDLLIGRGGDDTLNGGDGNDSMWAGTGNDMLDGGLGNDAMGGGTGNDRLNGAGGNDAVWGGAGVDTVLGGAGDDTIGGGDGDDVLNTGDGLNTAWGGAGNDRITGGAQADLVGAGAGNDTVIGNAGDDVLYGGAGADRVDGGGGNDIIGGGTGDDTVTGGAGADTFLFAALTGGESDTITDFGNGADLMHLFGVAGADEVAKFASLAITDTAGGATVTSAEGHQILLEGVSAASLSVGDFLFD